METPFTTGLKIGRPMMPDMGYGIYGNHADPKLETWVCDLPKNDCALANATLIVGAPAMYEALRACVRELERLGASDNDDTLGPNTVLAQARAALPKFGGEA